MIFIMNILNTRKGINETRSGQEIFRADLQEIVSPTSKNSQRLLNPEAKARVTKELEAVKEFKD